MLYIGQGSDGFGVEEDTSLLLFSDTSLSGNDSNGSLNLQMVL